MRVAYYTQPWFLDTSLPLIRAMSQRNEVHVFLELSPDARNVNWFWDPNDTRVSNSSGVQSLSAAARRTIFPNVSRFLDEVASFHLVVHTGHRAIAARAAIQTSLTVAATIMALRPRLMHVEHVWPRTLPLFFLTPGLPKLLAIHDVTTHPGDINTRMVSARRTAVPHSSRLLFYSSYTERQYARERAAQRMASRPTSMVPLGIREVFREWPGGEYAEREPTILFFGRLSTYKGVDVLFRALPEVAARVPGLRVVVAGQPEVGYSVPAAPQLSGDAELICRFEMIDNTTLRELFQQASVVVAPYLESSQSGVVQTAYAFGKPVVASDIGGLPEAVRDGVTGTLVPPGDADALARALVEVLLDGSARARMSAAIRDLETTYFGWGPIGEQLQAIWDVTAGQTPRRSGALAHADTGS